MSGPEAAAPGEDDLGRLLAGLRPRLRPETFVFLTVADGEAPAADPAVIGTFREAEGLTLIAEQAWAEAQGLAAAFPCRCITLEAHSALAAVGLMAAVAGALARAGIAANPVSAFHHDHLFVPAAEAERALAALERLSANAG